MSKNKELADYIMDQLSDLGNVRNIPMMGGYIFYYKERIFGGISPPSGGAKFDCAQRGGQQTAPYDMCEFCVYLRGQSRTPVPTDWWGTIRICASFAHTCADSRGRLSLQIGEGRFAFARGCGRTKRKKEESRSSLLFFAVSLIT